MDQRPTRAQVQSERREPRVDAIPVQHTEVRVQPNGQRSTISKISSQPSQAAGSSDQRNANREGGEPHKIFIWDPNGVYLDCSFPNPRYGHFLNHQKLKGARVVDLFPRADARRLKATIQATWKTQHQQLTQLHFERDAQRYEATITCVPTQEGQVIGFVTDRLVSSQGLVMVTSQSRHLPNSSFVTPVFQTGPKKNLASLTPQELNVLVVLGFRPSKEDGQLTSEKYDAMHEALLSVRTNHEIAKQLNLSVRTVKFHLTNIYRKLQITSRYQLFPPT